jgi:hypothetical protein
VTTSLIGRALEAVIEELDGLDDLIRFEGGIDQERLILNVAFVGDEHRGRGILPKRDDLDGDELFFVDGRAKDHRGEVGHVRENLAASFITSSTDLLFSREHVRQGVLGAFVDRGFPDVLGVVLITFFGRDAAGGSMGLFEIAILLQAFISLRIVALETSR